MRTNPEIDFPHFIIDTNEEINADPHASIYDMTDEQFEAHLAQLHADKLAGVI